MSSDSEFGWRGHAIAFAAVAALTFLAFVFSHWVLGGTAALVVCLSLAFTNALITILVLMNLIKQRASNQLLLFVAASLLALLIVLALLDVATRDTVSRRPVPPASPDWRGPDPAAH